MLSADRNTLNEIVTVIRPVTETEKQTVCGYDDKEFQSVRFFVRGNNSGWTTTKHGNKHGVPYEIEFNFNGPHSPLWHLYLSRAQLTHIYQQIGEVLGNE